MIFNIIKLFIEDTLRIKNVEQKYILYDCEKTEIENIRPSCHIHQCNDWRGYI